MVSEQNKIVLQIGTAALVEYRVYDEDGEWYAGSNKLGEALRYVEPGYTLKAIFEAPITLPTKAHHPVGAYFPIGQLEGDCSYGAGEWPCPVQGEPTRDSEEHLRGRWSNGDPVHIITDGSNRHVAPNLNGATWIPGAVEPYDRYAEHDRAKREGGYCRGCDEKFPAPQGEPSDAAVEEIASPEPDAQE